ncbi:hypothetical protein HID58_028187 [Brassica napus]|uniref:Uncharacterized protein n=1 Tax=Brassica napus TaxID=3708 RepID=A0ABQ7XG51_BRANA|nr:hypothetical protein HID58_028187 [Brassica napus]
MSEWFRSKGANWLEVNGNGFKTDSVKGFEEVVDGGEKVGEDLERLSDGLGAWVGEEKGLVFTRELEGRIGRVGAREVDEEGVWRDAVSDLFSVTVTEEDKVGLPSSVSIAMAPVEVVDGSRFSVEAAVMVGFISILRCPFREAPARAVLEVESVREGNSTGERGEDGSGGSGGRPGGGSPGANAEGFTPEVRPGTFHTGCIGSSVRESLTIWIL